MLIAPKKISVWLKRYLQESKIYSFFYSNLGWGSGSGRENFSTPSKYNRCYMTCFRTSFFITRFTTARIITQQVVFVFDRFLFLFLLFLRSMRLSTRTVQWGCFYTSVGQPRALHVNVADCFRCFFFIIISFFFFLFSFPIEAIDVRSRLRRFYSQQWRCFPHSSTASQLQRYGTVLNSPKNNVCRWAREHVTNEGRR